MVKFANKPQQKIMVTISVTFILVGLTAGLIAYPSVEIIKTLAEQIYDQRTELEQMYQKGQILKQTLKEYEEVKPTIASLNKVYLEKGNELAFITSLEKVAADNGVSHDIKLNSTSPNKTNDQLQYQLQTSGSLVNFIRYLAALEAQDFYININTIRLSSSGGNITSNQSTDSALQAILLAASYFKP